MINDCNSCEFSKNFKDLGGPWHCVSPHNKLGIIKYKELDVTISDCRFFEPIRSIDSLFEWDEAKNLINIEKHKISFSRAPEIWLDCVQLVSKKWDSNTSLGTEFEIENNPVRGQLIGRADGKYWNLTYVFRGPFDKKKYRVISIRRAREKEIKIYNQLKSM